MKNVLSHIKHYLIISPFRFENLFEIYNNFLLLINTSIKKKKMPFDPRNFDHNWNIEAEPDYFDPEQQVNMRATGPSRFLQPDLNGPDNQTFEDWM